jgi:hypothetical protein
VSADRARSAVLAADAGRSPRDRAWPLAPGPRAACRAPAGWDEAREVVSPEGRPARSARRKNRPDGSELDLAVEGGGRQDVASDGRAHRRGAARSGRRRPLDRAEPGEVGEAAQVGGACCAQDEYAAAPVACRLGGTARRHGRQSARRTDSRGQPGRARHPGTPGLGSHHRSSRSHPREVACHPAVGDRPAGHPGAGHLAGGGQDGGHGGGCCRAEGRAGSRLGGSRRRRGRPGRSRSRQRCRQDPGTREPGPGLAHPDRGRCLDVSPGTSWTLRDTPCMGTCTFSP